MEETKITRFLRDHHKVIQGLFAQLQAAPSRAPEMQWGVENELLMELEIHVEIERQALYSELVQLSDLAPRSMADENLAYDGDLRESIAAARREFRRDPMSPADRAEAMDALSSEFERHLHAQELDILPTAERMLKEARLRELAGVARAIRRDWLKRPEYRGFHTADVQDPHGGEQMRKIS